MRPRLAKELSPARYHNWRDDVRWAEQLTGMWLIKENKMRYRIVSICTAEHPLATLHRTSHL